MKYITTSLFGYNGDNSDTYFGYLQYLTINIRAYKVMYPNWKINLQLQSELYKKFKLFFDDLIQNDFLVISINEQKELCKNMLWRVNTVNIADYTICRDLDSLPTYRERQAVEVWIRDKTAFHAISDNKEHNEVLMGGMIGFIKDAFELNEFLDGYEMSRINFNIKGSDQKYLDKMLYHKAYKIGITEHRIAGLTQRMCTDKAREGLKYWEENKYFYDKIEDIEVTDINLTNEEKIESNNLVNYIGHAWFDIHPAKEFYCKHLDTKMNTLINEIENKHKIF